MSLSRSEVEAWWGPDEPLDPDLAEWLFDAPHLGRCLKHPLVFDVPYIPRLNARLNGQLRAKRAALAEAEADGNWFGYVMLHERPHRAEALIAVAGRAPDEDYWPLVEHVWVDSENLHQWGPAIRLLLEADRPGRESMMDDDERAALAAMGDPVKVYRGHQGRNANGWSWTTDPAMAERLARRLLGPERAYVAHGKVAKRHVVAYLTGRGESEIVADPALVRVYRTQRLSPVG